MNFDFSGDQKALKDQTGKFLREQCDLSAVRAILEGDAPYDRNLWEQMAEMGFMGAAIPEEYGGVQMGYLELCCIAEELGRAVAPVPFASSVYLAAEAILLAGSEDQKQKYLPKLASGETIGTLAVSEGVRPLTPDVIETTFDGNAISGAKAPVPDGDVADIAVVVANSSGGPVLCIVDLNADGVSREGIHTMDPTRSHGELTLTNAPAEALGAPGQGWSFLDRVYDRAAVLIAFEQVGGADVCLTMARDYSLERFAFGRPIGSFQAIKHRCADMYIKNELARSNAYFGAWALSTGAQELPLAAAGARVAATEAYHFASKESIQVHGGIGFTWESDCHFFYRRARLLGLMIGSPRVWKDRLVTALATQSAA